MAPIPSGNERVLRELIRANRGFRTFAQIVEKSAVLFVADDAFDYDEKAVQEVLSRNDRAGFAMLAEARTALATCQWTEEALKALMQRICEVHGVGMGKVAQPIRVAVTGSTISPSIHETLLILGKDKALSRIDHCLATRDPVQP